MTLPVTGGVLIVDLLGVINSSFNEDALLALIAFFIIRPDLGPEIT